MRRSAELRLSAASVPELDVQQASQQALAQAEAAQAAVEPTARQCTVMPDVANATASVQPSPELWQPAGAVHELDAQQASSQALDQTEAAQAAVDFTAQQYTGMPAAMTASVGLQRSAEPQDTSVQQASQQALAQAEAAQAAVEATAHLAELQVWNLGRHFTVEA